MPTSLETIIRAEERADCDKTIAILENAVVRTNYIAEILAECSNVFCVIINCGVFKTPDKVDVLKKIFEIIQ